MSNILLLVCQEFKQFSLNQLVREKFVTIESLIAKYILIISRFLLVLFKYIILLNF
jgi:hypothetical protein